MSHRRSLLDLKRANKRPSIRPTRAAKVKTSVLYVADKESLIKQYHEEYWEAFAHAQKLNTRNGTRMAVRTVTLRPAIEYGYFIIIDRFRWTFDRIEEEQAVFGGRGPYMEARIPIEQWNKLLQNSGALR